MKLNELFADDDAVSPVIGVILMVAITVILAAVIGTFVLGLGSEVQETPSAQFTFEEQSGSDSKVDITHSGGDPINPDNMEVSGAGVSGACSSQGTSTGTWDSVNSESEINAGSTCTVDPDSDGTIRVTWQSADGSTSDELATYEHTE